MPDAQPNAQLRLDTRRVFQVLMPHLPIQLIDTTTRVIFHDAGRNGAEAVAPRFALRRVDSCDGVVALVSTAPRELVMRFAQEEAAAPGRRRRLRPPWSSSPRRT